jgi:2-polyprenyl-6-hydroxyphenyl methylase / 3-demethylubiquinone-9 3-methyltransferase
MENLVNADAAELAKFSDLAHRWWDKNGEFKPLHTINPVRLNWIKSAVNIQNRSVLDVGCGGGILSESMAQVGALVTGIDLSVKALRVARLHALENGLTTIRYLERSAESMAQTDPVSFDVITCMEMLEHVPDPQSVVSACANILKPGGTIFFSTINRNAIAFFKAILGAEYLMGWVPKGTHEYGRLIKPNELTKMCRVAGLIVEKINGIRFDPVRYQASLSSDPAVNYLMMATKPVE